MEIVEIHDSIDLDQNDVDMNSRNSHEDILRFDLGCREEEYSSPLFDSNDTISLSVIAGLENMEIIQECNSDSDEQNETPKVGLHDFELLRYLGSGSYARVFQVRKLNGNDKDDICAMKVLRKSSIKDPKTVMHTIAERNILEKVNHPFLVDLKYAFQSESKLYYILEYLSGGDLFTYLTRESCLSEDTTRFYASEMVLALEYLHSLNIIFRDLKPENILFDWKGHIKLIDFGLSKEYLPQGDITYSFCGTYEYMAPEIMKKTGYGREVDWWSLGAVMYEMVTGHPPFCALFDTCEKIQKKTLNSHLKIPHNITRKTQDFIRKLLRKQPRSRLGAPPMGTLAIKQHVFFKNISWDDVFNRKLEPPYKPCLRSDGDVKYFDKEYTKRTPVDSYAQDVISESAAAVFRI